MLIYSQLADVCAPIDRSKYLGMISGLSLSGALIGMLVGGWLVKTTNSFEATFVLSFLVVMIAFAYFTLAVPETNPRRPVMSTSTFKEPLRTRAAQSFQNTIATMRKLPLIVLCSSLLDLSMRAGFTFLIPFYTAQVFGWTTWENTIFSAASAAAMAVSTMILLPAFDKVMRRWIAQKTGREQLESNASDERRPLIPPAADTADGNASDERRPLIPPAAETANGTVIGALTAEETTFTNAFVGLLELRLFTIATAIHCAVFALAQRDMILFAIIPLHALGHLSAIAARALLLEFAPADSYGTVNSTYAVMISLAEMIVIKATSTLYDLTSRTSTPSMAFGALEFLSVAAFAGTFLVTFRAKKCGPTAV
ncbi:hypothetical protein HDU86_000180 [Geranomyces michiganensis]|nr:hypothetical protein HDU86_000180 [Geranomyces michiganensis]